MFIGHSVEREPTFTNYGDACEFEVWLLSPTRILVRPTLLPELVRLISLSTRHIHKIHINCLEYIMVIIQIAAVITRVDQLPSHLSNKSKDARSRLPLLLSRKDNTNAECWTAKVTAKTPKSQALLEILVVLSSREFMCTIGNLISIVASAFFAVTFAIDICCRPFALRVIIVLVESDSLTIIQRLESILVDSRKVDEDILGTIIGRDETVSLFGKEFDLSCEFPIKLSVDSAAEARGKGTGRGQESHGDDGRKLHFEGFLLKYMWDWWWRLCALRIRCVLYEYGTVRKQTHHGFCSPPYVPFLMAVMRLTKKS
jgi:hypothetical protein